MVVVVAAVTAHNESFASKLLGLAVQDVEHGLDEVLQVILLLKVHGSLPQPRGAGLLVLINGINERHSSNFEICVCVCVCVCPSSYHPLAGP